jgi:NAD(P)H-dependent FMN reductase
VTGHTGVVPRLLVVHHTPSPALQEMLESVLAGARDDAIEGVEVVVRPALVASAVEVLEADGYLLGTPANIGYISGALKHFFDTVYYPCLEATRGRPFASYVHGNLDATGAVRAIDAITTGLGWRAVAPTLVVNAAPTATDRDQLYELGGTVAATLVTG